jgi:hypothetical protein
MIQRIIDDVKLSIGIGVRQTSLAAMAAVALFITTSFLCAAAFVAVLDRYGLIQACLAGAGLFFIVTLIAAGTYMVRKRQAERRVKEHAKTAAKTMLADPMVVAAGLQVVRALGVKRLIPLLAVGGLALGLMAGRNSAAGDQTPAE